MATVQTAITDADLRQLQQALPLMTDAEQQRALEILRQELGPYHRGFRSNRIIDTVRPPFVRDASGRLMPGVSRKQTMFLALDCLEALYGGGVGGAKSDSLLIGGLQYVDVPGYSALILRETKKELSSAGGLLDRAKEWLAPFRVTGEVKWSAEDDSFFFQTSGRPSRLTFGYCANLADRYQYKSTEFQYIAWDEVTEQLEECYLYLFMRLRRLMTMLDIPPRIRAGTNPGGTYSEWVKERWITDDYLHADPEGRFGKIWTKFSQCGECGGDGQLDDEPCIYCDGKGSTERFFVPARVQDNPFIDRKSYLKSLIHLPVHTRAQYEKGDWDVVIEGGLFHRDWIYDHRWTRRGLSMICRKPLDGPQYDINRIAEIGEQITFLTADTAWTKKTWGSYSCIAVWTLLTRSFDLLLRYGWLARVELPELMPKLISLYRGEWDEHAERESLAQFCIVEEKASGIAIVQEGRTLASEGITILPYNPGTLDKASRWTVAVARWQAGQVWIPADNPGWLQPLLRQLFEVDGVNMEKKDDFVDCATMACHYVTHQHATRRQSSGTNAPMKFADGLPQRPNLRIGRW